jgi:uncharacterized protein
MNRLQAMPVSLAERYPLLDILRGFALLGVLLDNLFAFTGWGFQKMDQWQKLPTWPADGLFGFLELAFVNGKFYSLFSLLFGIGFSIILLRNEERSINPLKIFYRRLLVLLFLFGLPHLFFIWEGDILSLYALVGFLLPLFRKCSDRALLTWVICLILSPLLIDSCKVIFHFQPGAYLEKIGASIDKITGVPTNEEVGKYLYTKKDGWQHWRNWQASGFFYRFAYLIDSNRIPKVLAMFLLGFLAGRKMIFAKINEYVPLLLRIRRWGYSIGIPASLAMAYFEIDGKSIPDPLGLLDTFFYAISVIPLSLAYTSSICLRWVRKKQGNAKLRILAPMGRMALTNYLMQTFLAIAIYYGVGFGLGGNIGPTIFLPLGLIVYLLQLAYSQWWLHRFQYGPFEYIWRILTYGQLLAMRKTHS